MGTESNTARARAKVGRVRQRIEVWRRTRAKRSPMPQELWTAATELARELGAYRVAQELGVGYGALKDRLGADGESSAREAKAFVEIDGASLFSAAPATARGEVELADVSGTKMVIRLGVGQAVDVAAVLAAFRTVPA
jgi:hypothetical protein